MVWKLSLNQPAGLQSRKPERVLENTQGPCGGDRTKCRQGFHASISIPGTVLAVLGAGKIHCKTYGTKEIFEVQNNSDISSHGYTMVFEFIRDVAPQKDRNKILSLPRKKISC